jgi:leader peptidase (prepilin peptidase)/N-methyltransferase
MFFLIWGILIFLLGATVGSFLNVCITRLPLEKSLLWPPTSRCGHCLQAIGLWDNVPLLSYWRLGGRCRSCGTSFSMQYFVVELLTALGFVGLYWLVVFENVHLLPVLQGVVFPWGSEEAVIICLHHAALFGFLMVAAWCDLNGMSIPLSVTVTGTIVGLTFSIVWPWPWPNEPVFPVQQVPAGGHWLLPALFNPPPVGALHGWPFWWPLPDWCANGGNWQTGLANGLAGMLAGTFLSRGIRSAYGAGRGKEGLGLGDADLMMMAGAFLGWQEVVVAFFLSAFVALVPGLIKLIITRDQALPYGPSLALAILATCMGWNYTINEFNQPPLHPMQFLCFNAGLLLVLGAIGGGFMFMAALFFRMSRRVIGKQT